MARFKVMTWNVENLFRPPMGDAEETARFQRKLALLAGVIQQQNPDVVGFQEVGGEEPVQALQNALGGAYPHRAVSAFPDQRGIRVAFISKIPIDDEENIADFPPGPALSIHNLTAEGAMIPITRMGRGALRIRVRVNGLSVDVINAHLKSKLLTFPTASGGSSFKPQNENQRAQAAGIALMRRMAEAVTLRIRANEFLEHNSQNPLMVMGDFNDVPEAQTSLLLTGPPGSEIGTGGFHRPDQGDDTRLFNLAPLIAEDRRFSRIHNGRGELLDQIFASEELLPVGADNRRRLPVVDSLVEFDETRIASVSDDPSARVDEVRPDHAPVVAEFDL